MELADRLALIRKHIDRAHEATAAAPALSPVTVAVVGEFHKKSAKLVGDPSREILAEVEQAGDCAKLAATADTAATPTYRELVGVAHDSLCMLKNGY